MTPISQRLNPQAMFISKNQQYIQKQCRWANRVGKGTFAGAFWTCVCVNMLSANKQIYTFPKYENWKVPGVIEDIIIQTNCILEK